MQIIWASQMVSSGPPPETFYFELEDESGVLLLEDNDFLLLEAA